MTAWLGKVTALAVGVALGLAGGQFLWWFIQGLMVLRYPRGC